MEKGIPKRKSILAKEYFLMERKIELVPLPIKLLRLPR
jgi:hypothetical protein